MMTRSSGNIRTPEAEQLAHWKAMSDAAQAHKFFADNPKVIDKLATSIQGAYALTAEERKERDEAVKAVSDAKAEVKQAKAVKEASLADAEKVKIEAEAYSKTIRAEADIYKANALSAVAKVQQKIIDDQADLTHQQEMFAKDFQKLTVDQKKVNEGFQAIEDWKADKEAWEQDYTERSAKLDGKLRKAVKG